jgi:tungstate transport system ATP-binding protein
MELKDIVKTYGRITALDHVSLKVRRGETLALLGSNGAGKTTMLKIMGGILKQDSGNIYYGREKIDDRNLKLLRRNSTMVFQKTVLFNSDVYGNVAYGLELRRIPEADLEHRVREALSQVGLEGYEKRPVKTLSGGEQQRVSLARALALKPELLLLDEPTANLDPENAAAVEKIIKEFKGATTVILATHNLFQAKRLSDRIAYMARGVLVEEGSPEEIFQRPRDERTARFVRGFAF